MTVPDVIARVCAPTIIEAVRREYPNAPRHVMRDADDLHRPRELHPAFYGCFDWHSAVEMHWALVVLVRDLPEADFVAAAREVLSQHLTADNLQVEAEYLAANPGFERPYGWGWALELAAELASFAEAGDADAVRWAAAVRPLAEVIETALVQWLPRPRFPDRSGMHSNSAFSLTRATSWARHRSDAGRPELGEAIAAAADRWFGADEQYSSAFEPGASDFLSPTLTEAELMCTLLSAADFADWFGRFRTASFGGLLEPVRVTDPEDGQGAHLHGLNLHRIRGLRSLVGTGARQDDAVVERAITRLTEAGMQALLEPGWMSEHWLAAYAVLAFRGLPGPDA